jgi:hypothetical protein
VAWCSWLKIGVDYVNADFLAIGKGVNDGAKSFGGAAVAPDHTTQVIWVHVNFE